MGMQIKHVEFVCDGKPHGSESGYICGNSSNGALAASGTGTDLQFAIDKRLAPRGWYVRPDAVLCPDCVETMVMRKLMETKLPDPSQDPPGIRMVAERIKAQMRADLEADSSLLAEIPTAERIRVGESPMDSEPDFVGTPGGGEHNRVEIRCNRGVVEIRWPNASGGMASITLQYSDKFELVDPPPFLAADLVTWVQGCLHTFRHESALPDEIVLRSLQPVRS